MRTVRDVAAKILANNNVPCRAMSSVKLLFDLSGDVLLDVVFFEGGGRDVHALLLQVLTHIDRFDDGFRATDAVVRRVLRCSPTVGGRDSVLLVGHDEDGGIVEATVVCHRSLNVKTDGDPVGLELRRHFLTRTMLRWEPVLGRRPQSRRQVIGYWGRPATDGRAFEVVYSRPVREYWGCDNLGKNSAERDRLGSAMDFDSKR